MLYPLKKIARKIIAKIRLLDGFYYDFTKYRKYSLTLGREDLSFDELLGLIIRLYHSLEKSLTSKEFKKESSLKNVMMILDVLKSNKNIDYNNRHVRSALYTLKLYFDKHPSDGSIELETQRRLFKNITSNVDVISNNIGGVKLINIVNEIPTKDYLNFVRNRVSIREFSERNITEKELIDVVNIAKYCPSACNRQAVKLLYSLDKEKNERILRLQNGSRTFRNHIPGLLLIVSDLRYQEGCEERNLGLIEGGIWISSLVNSFHASNLGSCVLNWCVRPNDDKKIRRLIDMPEYYQIVSMIAFGHVNSEQLVPYSIRKDPVEFLSKIESITVPSNGK